MSAPEVMGVKIIGKFNVGKTTLLKRFVERIAEALSGGGKGAEFEYIQVNMMDKRNPRVLRTPKLEEAYELMLRNIYSGTRSVELARFSLGGGRSILLVSFPGHEMYVDTDMKKLKIRDEYVSGIIGRHLSPPAVLCVVVDVRNALAGGGVLLDAKETVKKFLVPSEIKEMARRGGTSIYLLVNKADTIGEGERERVRDELSRLSSVVIERLGRSYRLPLKKAELVVAKEESFNPLDVVEEVRNFIAR